MKRKKVKVMRELSELLSTPEFREFTLIDLRDAYESRFGLGEFATSSDLRKWIYRRLAALVKKGSLIKTAKNDDQAANYKVVEQARELYTNTDTAYYPNSHEDLIHLTSESPQISALKTKRNQYQVDMLACAGECKEYQQLAQDFPHLRKEIDPMYRSARERSSELMGQLRAVNNLLKSSGISR